MSGGSPHELYDSMGLRPRMRLYFLNIGARLKNSVKNKSSEHCLSAASFFSRKSTIFITCRQYKSFATVKTSEMPINCLYMWDEVFDSRGRLSNDLGVVR